MQVLKTYSLYSELSACSNSVLAWKDGQSPDPEREVSYAFYNSVTHIADKYCKRRNGQ